MDYRQKYLKYKNKYLQLKGGSNFPPVENDDNNLLEQNNDDDFPLQRQNAVMPIEQNELQAEARQRAREREEERREREEAERHRREEEQLLNQAIARQEERRRADFAARFGVRGAELDALLARDDEEKLEQERLEEEEMNQNNPPLRRMPNVREAIWRGRENEARRARLAAYNARRRIR